VSRPNGPPMLRISSASATLAPIANGTALSAAAMRRT
jgi:hypothetical protein